MASTALTLIGSPIPSRPAGRSSIATNTTVCPSCRSDSARRTSASSAMPSSRRWSWLPTATRRLSTIATTPRPGRDSKSEASTGARPLVAAPRTIAPASGCSLKRSTLAANASTSASVKPSTHETVVSSGFPCVTVPVLSTTTVSTAPSRSSVSAFLNSTPSDAPRPLATMIDIGVARPSAHGHAMIEHGDRVDDGMGETRFGTDAPPDDERHDGDRPSRRARSSWTRRRPAAESARGCAALRPTIDTMRASIVSAPTRSARMTNDPVPFTVPPTT